jgi:hypothetical protein
VFAVLFLSVLCTVPFVRETHFPAGAGMGLAKVHRGSRPTSEGGSAATDPLGRPCWRGRADGRRDRCRARPDLPPQTREATSCDHIRVWDSAT